MSTESIAIRAATDDDREAVLALAPRLTVGVASPGRSDEGPAYNATVIFSAGAYQLDDDPGRVDRDAVWEFLSTQAYWGRFRTRADFEKQLASAWRVVGAYEAATGRQVGFARAVSDGVSFAYLADVFVLPDARGAGLGKELVATMIDRGQGAGFRWTLHTSDAHGLYGKFGFAKPDHTYLERPRQQALRQDLGPR